MARMYFSGRGQRARQRAMRWMMSVSVLAVAAFAGNGAKGLDARSESMAVTAGGEVSLDSSDAAPRWLTDSNVVALVDSMQRLTVAAARYQLQSWASDSTVNLALMFARDHAALLSTVDSVAAIRRIAVRQPAIADSLLAPYAPQVTSLYGLWAQEREKRFLSTQVVAHTRAVTDLMALSAVARDPDLRATLDRAVELEREHLARLGVSAPTPATPAPGASARDTSYRR